MRCDKYRPPPPPPPCACKLSLGSPLPPLCFDMGLGREIPPSSLVPKIQDHDSREHGPAPRSRTHTSFLPSSPVLIYMELQSQSPGLYSRAYPRHCTAHAYMYTVYPLRSMSNERDINARPTHATIPPPPV